MESIDHLFLHCPFIQQTWSLSYWHFNVNFFANLSIKQFILLILDKNNKLFSSAMHRAEFLTFTAVLFDNVWLNRNLLLHGSPSLPVNKLVVSVSKQSNAHWLSIVESLQTRSTPTQAWKKPHNGWYKINTDSTFVKGSATAGIVIRNWNGSIIHAFTQKNPCLEPLVAECLAIYQACLTAEELNLDKAIFETDCLNATTAINGASLNCFWPADPVVEKIKRAWSC
ncbi:hypothetical protein CASFOL_004752 [Castilleja foliolosa]|uniref:RNase H type-1 domain-containing protein n=1 Tax=Castilleja foliolosa TaxID=1961234 RepID=A0ABD3EBD0_9LAMI